jgi:SAM-dependent methyltransferase
MPGSVPTTVYDEKFYDLTVEGSLRSARIVVPLVFNLNPIRSVVDFGCGHGTWLKAFQELGIVDIQGIDGDYVDRRRILIDPGKFLAADLTRPIRLDRNYDLAMSLEVGEHLPRSSSVHLVDSLVSASRFILFSAAIPNQGGYSHINEQWPEFWRSLFLERGYRRLDCIRSIIFTNKNIEIFYRQNLYIFAAEPVFDEIVRGHPGLDVDQELEIVHKGILNNYKSCASLFREAVKAGMKSVRHRFSS